MPEAVQVSSSTSESITFPPLETELERQQRIVDSIRHILQDEALTTAEKEALTLDVAHGTDYTTTEFRIFHLFARQAVQKAQNS